MHNIWPEETIDLACKAPIQFICLIETPFESAKTYALKIFFDLSCASLN